MRNSEENDHFLVQSPITGEHVDLMPFFKFLNNADNHSLEQSLKCSYEYVDDIIRLISTGFDVDLDDVDKLSVRNLYSTLYQIRDMFQGITVLKKN